MGSLQYNPGVAVLGWIGTAVKILLETNHREHDNSLAPFERDRSLEHSIPSQWKKKLNVNNDLTFKSEEILS